MKISSSAVVALLVIALSGWSVPTTAAEADGGDEGFRLLRKKKGDKTHEKVEKGKKNDKAKTKTNRQGADSSGAVVFNTGGLKPPFQGSDIRDLYLEGNEVYWCNSNSETQFQCCNPIVGQYPRTIDGVVMKGYSFAGGKPGKPAFLAEDNRGSCMKDGA